MKRKRVKSSAMLTVGYHEDLKVLEVEFPSKEVYQYFDVPAHVHFALMQASSLGTYFNAYIKNQYEERRIGK
jgi:hypothetical protein